MAGTVVKFLTDLYGNYQDNYYTRDYQNLISTLQAEVKLTCSVNLGYTDGVVISNVFQGDFTKYNCAIVEHEVDGTHLYKIVKKQFIKRNLWRITMVKDLVSCKYNSILQSKMLVSRIGISRTTYDPILFTNESFTLSKVKKEQRLINEMGSKSYGYLLIWARNSLDGTIKWDATPVSTQPYDIYVENISELNNIIDKKIRISYSYTCRTGIRNIIPSVGVMSGCTMNYRETQDIGYESLLSTLIPQDKNTNISMTNDEQPIWSQINVRYLAKCRALIPSGYLDINTVPYTGKIVYDGTSGIYYKILETAPSTDTTLVDMVNANLEEIIGDYDSYTIKNRPQVRYVNTYKKLYLVQVGIEPNPAEFTFKAYPNAVDQPLQMQFIPFIEDAYIRDVDNENSYEFSKQLTEQMLYDLVAKYGGQNAKLLDVQIIPYSPIAGMENAYNATGKVFNLGYSIPTDVIVIDDTYAIPVYSVLRTSYIKQIPMEITFSDYKTEQYNAYHITSPSGAGVYDFSVAKNSGLEGFYIKVDLRPYASFHQIQPIYKSIYGGNFTDTRGLVFQEDMSLTQVSSAWETYKRQNINYVNSFNAEVDYKTSNFTINAAMTPVNFVFDSGQRILEAAATSAEVLATGVSADVWLGIKGAAAGAAGAAAIMQSQFISEGLEFGQMMANMMAETKLFANEIGLAQKQFNYNIGNIQALPENLTKVNGIFQSNNIVPYLQIFGPTEEEIQRLTDYLDVYGVNCGQMIDLTTRDFNFLQGVMVVCNTPLTYEEYKAITTELQRGVRLYAREV